MFPDEPQEGIMMTNALRTGLTRVTAAVAATAMLAVAAACGADTTPHDSDRNAEQVPTPNGPILVTASINQWGALAKQIGGDDVEVTSVLSSTAVDAHDFEPKTSDMATLSSADVVVANGAGYDSWATKTTGRKATVVSAAQMVGAMEGDNPHLWFSKDARIAMAQELANTFAKRRPEKKKEFAERLKDFKAQESQLDEWMSDWMTSYTKSVEKPTYAATEPLAYYLMSDLGFSDETPKGYAQSTASEGEVAPADLQDFQSLIESRKVDVLINNTQEASDATNMITGTAGRSEVPVVDISEQMPEDAQTLTGWILTLVKSIAKTVDPQYEEIVECAGTGDGSESGESVTGDGTANDASCDANGSADGDAVDGDGKNDSTDDGNSDPSDSDGGSSTPSNEGQTDPGR